MAPVSSQPVPFFNRQQSTRHASTSRHMRIKTRHHDLSGWFAETRRTVPPEAWQRAFAELMADWKRQGQVSTRQSVERFLGWLGQQQLALTQRAATAEGALTPLSRTVGPRFPQADPDESARDLLQAGVTGMAEPPVDASGDEDGDEAEEQEAATTPPSKSATPGEPARPSEPPSDQDDGDLATGGAAHTELDSLNGQSLAMAPSDTDEKSSGSDRAASDEAEDVGPPGETFWQQMIDWPGWWAFLTNRRRQQDASGRWRFSEPIWDPGKAFIRDAAKIPLNPVPYEAIGALMSGDVETALKEAAVEIAIGKVFKYGGRLYDKLPGGRFRSLGAAAEKGGERSAREVTEEVAEQARRRAKNVAAARGPTIRNAHLAGKKHPVTGIPFDKDGYPKFAGVARRRVKIKQTGHRPSDNAAANKAAGLESTPDGYTWHHHQDGTTMELVPKKIHEQTGHTGGVAGLKNSGGSGSND